MRLPRLAVKNNWIVEMGNTASNQHRSKGHWAKVLIRSAAAIGVGALLAGCETRGWMDPKEVGVRSGVGAPLAVPILHNLDPSIDEVTDDFTNATDPTPEDLKSNSADYQISRNDLLSVSITDLMGPGQETVRTTRVSETGKISLPYLGAVQAEGLSELDLEQTIVAAYRQANLIQNAQVSVTVVEARGRSIEILGAVNQPGQYAILDPDFRLLDALVLARDTNNPLVEYAYVIRKPEEHRRPTTAPANNAVPGGPTEGPATGPSLRDLVPGAQPQSRNRGAAASYARGSSEESSVKHLLALTDAPADAPADASQPAAPATQPSPTSDTGATAPASGPATTEAAANGTAATGPSTAASDLSTLTAQPGTIPATQPEMAATAPASAPAGSQPFEFNAPTYPTNVRIIRIPITALRNGDLKYNIAIKPRDLIVVQNLVIGEYYMGGHVARPGVYTLSGRKITLREAVISAGMFDELAIPQRTDIIRRLRPDHEVIVRLDLDKVFAGQQPDLYLKPDDQIMVGTNALAPFVAAIRGAFRITYGFGFLYDRNYAYSSSSGGLF